MAVAERLEEVPVRRQAAANSLRYSHLSRSCESKRSRRSRDTAGRHPTIESRPLALPDVLPARARHRLRGVFLGQCLPADRTISSPHIESTFSSTYTVQRGWAFIRTDPCVRFFLLLKSGEKRQRLSAGRDLLGQLIKLRRVLGRAPSSDVRIYREFENLFYAFVRELRICFHHRLDFFLQLQ